MKLFRSQEPQETRANVLAIQKKDADLLKKALFHDRVLRNNFLPYIRYENKGLCDRDGVALCNECELGKWIEYGSKRYGHLKIFAAFKEVHTNAHLCAKEIAKLHSAGDQQFALEILNGPYLEMVRITQTTVMKLHKELAFSKSIL